MPKQYFVIEAKDTRTGQWQTIDHYGSEYSPDPWYRDRMIGRACRMIAELPGDGYSEIKVRVVKE